jgi:regulation of enolase protein 1 (concanavalin A-like superfamily)
MANRAVRTLTVAMLALALIVAPSLVVPRFSHAAPAGIAEDFEGVAVGSDPVGWLDTGAGNGLVEDDSLFSVMSVGGSQVLGTDSTAANIHSHLVSVPLSAAGGFTLSGRMMMTSSKSGVGVTVLSDYPSSDSYYRLRRYSGAGGSFRLSAHGTSLSGSLDTGVVPVAGEWYEFAIEVDDTGSATEVRAKVWAEGSAEPSGWQASGSDGSGSRLTSGSVGVWAYSSGSKYWDDFVVGDVPVPGPWDVVVSSSGSGVVSVSPDPAGFPGGYPDGTVVELSAVPSAGWEFAGWSGDVSGSVNPVSVTLNADVSVQALFVEDVPVSLTTSVVGDGVVVVDPDQAEYSVGDVVSVTASPGVGQRFVGWSGDVSGSQNPLSITMADDVSITATFEPVGDASVTTSVQGQGTVTIDPAGPYSTGDPVTATATPAAGWRFDRWVADPPVPADWWDPQWGYRLGVAVDAAGQARLDTVVDVPVDFTAAFQQLGLVRGVDIDSLRVVEVDAQGAVVDPNVAFQFIPSHTFSAATAATGSLWIDVEGATAGNETRRYDVYFDVIGSNLSAASVTPRISTDENIVRNGLDTVRVVTEAGTYYYDTAGGGFSSVVDTDGNDWVSWNSGSGSSGEYRGIPNLVYPNSRLHPGADNATTTVVATGPLVTRLRTVTDDQQWTVEWDIGPSSARLTVIDAADDYWFLYEGTPGGSLDAATDVVVRSNGTSTTAGTSWTGDVTGDEWVFFGDPGVGRSLYVVNHQDDSISDSYRAMDGVMTVFGFGRTGLSADLDHVPGQYTVGLVDSVATSTVGEALARETEPVAVTVGAAESHLGASGASVADFVLNGAVDLTAVFVQDSQGSLTTDVVGAGSISVDPDLPSYAIGQSVTLTANPSPGSTFAGWSGDASGTTNPVVVTIAADTSVTATFQTTGDGPLIDVWHGLDQQFGAVGVPQAAVNILGNVSDPDGVASLTFSLNGGPETSARIGSDSRRLARAGDFNIELPITDLDNGDNDLRLTAIDGDGDHTVVQMNVDFVAGNTWPTTYDVDWSTVTDLTDVAQPVDGRWVLEGDGVRIIEPSYDRLLALGDVSWTDYEITVPVTINAIDESGFSSGPSGTAAALGVLMRWGGHTDDPIVTSQPKTGWRPHGATGWWWWDTPTSARLQLSRSTGGNIDATSYGTPPAVGTTLVYKMRVETETNGLARYRLKVWPSTQSEPAAWTLDGTGSAGDVTNGSLLLLAHHVDATFGDVQIRPVNGSTGQFQLVTDTSGSGTVAVSPDQSDFAYGEQATITATPQPGWVFSGWSGDATGSANPLTVTVTGPTQITANFVSTSSDPVIGNVVVTPYADGAVVAWTTDKPTTGVVSYGTTAAYGLGTATSTTLSTSHSVSILGLDPSTTYHFRIEATDGSANSSFTSDDTFTTSTPGASFASDDFNTCSLDPVWSFVDPVGDGSVSFDGTRVSLAVPGGVTHDVWTGGNMAPRLMQSMADGDFVVEAKFDSAVTAKYQMQGFIVEQDAQNFIRFDVHYDGSSPRLFAATFSNGSPTAQANVAVPVSSPVWLRVGRSGDTWSFDYSTDGVNWTTGASFSFALNVSSAGVFAGNTGGNTPAHTAIIDYVFDAAAPILDEDADNPDCGGAVTYTLDVSAVGSGSVAVAPDQATYQPGDTVTLTATPDSGWEFAGWSGDATGTQNPLTVSVNADTDIVATFTEEATGASLVSDDFNACSVDPVWSFVDPVGDGSLSLDGTHAALTVAGGVAHDVWSGGNMAPRLMQSMVDGDFVLEAKFDSVVSAKYQMQGFIVEQDAQNFIRFDVYSAGGSSPKLFAATFTGGSPTSRANVTVPASSPMWLRVGRAGDTWSFDYSTDGANWTTGASFSFALNVSSAGVFAGNAGGNAPVHTALVDYVFDAAAPILDEDADNVTCS